MDRNDSALLHAGASRALALAASPIDGPARPVGVVLEDGTVWSLEPSWSRSGHDRGQVSGRNWTLWWERRSWAEA